MKIAIVKTSSLGDIVHTFPTLEFLKIHFPDAEIHWIVEKPFQDLLQSHPFISRVWTVDTKLWRKKIFTYQVWKEILDWKREIRQYHFDVAIDLQGNVKSGLVLSCLRAKQKVGFAWNSLPEKPNALFTRYRYSFPKGLSIQEDYLSVVRQHFKVYKDFKLSYQRLQMGKEQCDLFLEFKQRLCSDKHHIMVAFGSAWKNKQLTIKTLVQFLNQIREKENIEFFFIWASSEEEKIAIELQKQVAGSVMCPCFDIPVLQNLMYEMDLIMSVDSFPLHLASTTPTATYSIFGPSFFEKYAPLGAQHRAYQGNCPYGETFPKRCSLLRSCKTGACTQYISAEELFSDFYPWYIEHLTKKE